jgi:WD40 repeat protein
MISNIQLNFQATSFSPDGKYFACGVDKISVGIWEVVSGMKLYNLEGHTSFVSSTLFSPCGSYLLSGSEKNCFRFWRHLEGVFIAESQEFVDEKDFEYAQSLSTNNLFMGLPASMRSFGIPRVDLKGRVENRLDNLDFLRYYSKLQYL